MSIQEPNGAIYLDPQLALAYNNRGDAYRDLGQYQRAIQDYNEAIRLDPQLALAHNNRGNAYKDLGQHQKAIQDYNRNSPYQAAWTQAPHQKWSISSSAEVP